MQANLHGKPSETQSLLLTYAQQATDDSLVILNVIDDRLNQAIVLADSSIEEIDKPETRGLVN